MPGGDVDSTIICVVNLLVIVMSRGVWDPDTWKTIDEHRNQAMAGDDSESDSDADSSGSDALAEPESSPASSVSPCYECSVADADYLTGGTGQ